MEWLEQLEQPETIDYGSAHSGIYNNRGTRWHCCQTGLQQIHHSWRNRQSVSDCHIAAAAVPNYIW